MAAQGVGGQTRHELAQGGRERHVAHNLEIAGARHLDEHARAVVPLDHDGPKPVAAKGGEKRPELGRVEAEAEGDAVAAPTGRPLRVGPAGGVRPRIRQERCRAPGEEVDVRIVGREKDRIQGVRVRDGA